MTAAARRDPAPETLHHDRQWWRNAVVYQIYPRSFADGNGDGIGDLTGIAQRLPALADLGVDAIWLSPFYRSPQADAGYDVADYRDVDPLFGTLADFDALLDRAHALGLKVIVDLVPNHSSDEHPWFQQALAAGPGSPERDRYVFRDGQGAEHAQPPNNWLSVFGGPAWTRTTNPDGSLGQWYLHLFDSRQPDFNWENPEVRAEFESVLRFWLDRGVDGFRVDVAHSLIKQAGLPDHTPDPHSGVMGFEVPAIAPPEQTVDGNPDPAVDLAAVQDAPSTLGPMWDQDGVHEIYRSWRTVLDEYRPARIMVAEAWVQPLTRLARYVRPDEMHQAFNFDYLEAPWDAAVVRAVIRRSLAVNAIVGAPTTWVLSNHDVVRHPSRFGLPAGAQRPNGIGADDPQPDAALGLRRGRAATLTMLGLPGSAYLYQGEELGLPEHTSLDDHLRQDPTWWRSEYTQRGRDGCRVPLPWESGRPGLGFSGTGESWLPQPDSFRALARDRQSDDPESTLTMYRSALRLRSAHRLGSGGVQWLDGFPTDVVAYRNGEVTVVANMGRSAVTIPPGAPLLASAPLPDDGTLPPDTTVWLTEASG
ncbi:MAG TPA: glycoside hydrolase family 13 protein [Nakamurella sp.]|nr:glycoside hydrolase family 13 protein [Nakamurella sp.]